VINGYDVNADLASLANEPCEGFHVWGQPEPCLLCYTLNNEPARFRRTQPYGTYGRIVQGVVPSLRISHAVKCYDDDALRLLTF